MLSPREIPAPFCRRLGFLALCLMLVPVAAGAEWIDLGNATPVTVEVIENGAARSVYAITIGGFEAEAITIDGQTWYEIELPGESSALEAGLPALPDVRRALAIADDRAMTVRVIESEFVDLPDMPVAPSKGNLLRTMDPAMVPYSFDPFYQSQGVWPKDVVVGEDPHIIRDMRGMLVDANVFQYLPAARTLRVYTRLVVEVTAGGPGQINVLDPTRAQATVDPQFANLYADHFLNAPVASRYTPVQEVGGLLIISADSFAPAMQPLVEWKQQKGMETRLVTLSQTGSSFSQIKSYITAQYNDWAPAYVLLVGDIDQIPIAGESDPEYSTVAGSDNYPELFIGRFSAQNVDHVNTQVLRTITYERDQAAGNAFPQSGMGIASNEGPGDDGEYDYQHADNIRTDLLGYGYLGVDQFYQPNATANQVTTALHAGRGFINYTGHGSATAWSTTGFSNSHVNALANQNQLPFICSVACNNGTFTGTCFAEAWLRATDGGVPTGAIATYMSYISQSWNPPMCGQDEVTDLLVQDEMRTIGGLFFNGSCQMMDEYGSNGANEFLNWTIFGDPSVLVRSKAAVEMTVSHTGVLLIGMTEYTVDTGVAGAACALYADGMIYGRSVSDGSGMAVFTLTEPITEPMDLTLTVTAYNMCTTQEAVAVLPADGPYLLLETTTILDATGDADGALDLGEAVDLDVMLENVGVEAASGVTAILVTADPYVTIHVGAASYPVIPAGGYSTGDVPFAVSVSGDVPDEHVAQFNLTVTDGVHVWDLVLNVPVQVPALSVAGSLIDDVMGGDGSGTADAGETFMMQVRLANAGQAPAAEISGALACDHPDVVVIAANGTCALAPDGGEGLLGTFEVMIDPAYAEPGEIEFEVSVITAAGHNATLPFVLTVGGWFDDMEAESGWTIGAVGDDATAGSWVAVDPVGTAVGGQPVAPEDDHTVNPGVICFVTGNGTPGYPAVSSDLDGGTTTLLSPVFDLDGATSATVSYWRWFTNDAGVNPGEDAWRVEVTNNGADWVALENTLESNAAWQRMEFELSAYVNLTGSVQLRFVATDGGLNSLVEAGVDDFGLDANFGSTTAVNDGPELPAVLALGDAYPNPFNPATRITFALPRASEVDLAVYDISGRRVATLMSGMVDAGHHEVVWQGRDDRGGVVSSGVYFSRLISGAEMQTRKMTLLK